MAKTETSDNVTVANTTTVIQAANLDRVYLYIVNDSDEAVYLNIIGSAAVLNKGIRLKATGGSITIDNSGKPSYERITAAVNGICSSGGKLVTVTETTR